MRVRLVLSLALLLALTAFTLGTTPVAAQSPEDEVRAVIDKLFDGMRAGDSTMVSSTFYKGALMGRAMDEGYGARPVTGFINMVGTPHDEVWDERIWDVKIMVDQRLASAWMEYAFYLGKNLHHCGVNSMQFYKTDEGWKITYLADTNRGTNCDIPAGIQEGNSY